MFVWCVRACVCIGLCVEREFAHIVHDCVDLGYVCAVSCCVLLWGAIPTVLRRLPNLGNCVLLVIVGGDPYRVPCSDNTPR